MNNQKGEVVTGVMVVIMVGMMIFGMFSMHGGHGDRHDHKNVEQKQGQVEKGQQHMHDGDHAPEQDPRSAPEEKNR